MLKVTFVLLCLLGMSTISKPMVYLWQMKDEQSSSCCLHINNVDICNPDHPCTRFLGTDLNSISDYISRLLATEKGALDPHKTILTQIQRYIRTVLMSPYNTIAYRLDLRYAVPFYHDVIVTQSSKKQLEKAKPKVDEPHPLLVKLGLVRIINKKKRI